MGKQGDILGTKGGFVAACGSFLGSIFGGNFGTHWCQQKAGNGVANGENGWGLWGGGRVGGSKAFFVGAFEVF